LEVWRSGGDHLLLGRAGVGTYELGVSADNALTFEDGGSEAMRIDANQNLLVGTTSESTWESAAGFRTRQSGSTTITRDGNPPLYVNRLTNDGDIIVFKKGTTTVGSIGSEGGDSLYVEANNCGLRYSISNRILPCGTNGAGRDDVIDLGSTGARFDDIYATNGTIQTSDRNEKQDIAELTEAETRVAVAAKGLLRKFRWQSAVSLKGDEARIHFGIIAQDLQDAFTAEGLDASDYAMFCSNTWWETKEVIPAVEEELDEDGNVVTEAQEEKIVTNTYDSEEEAPENAIEKTRLGVRYSELLAFIIASL